MPTPTVSFATLLADTPPPARPAGSAQSEPSRPFHEYLTAARSSRVPSQADSTATARQPAQDESASQSESTPKSDAEQLRSPRSEAEPADGTAASTDGTSIVVVVAPVVVESAPVTDDGTAASPNDAPARPAEPEHSAPRTLLTGTPALDSEEAGCTASPCTADGLTRPRAMESDRRDQTPVQTDQPSGDTGSDPQVATTAVPRPRLQPADTPTPDGTRPPPSDPPRPRPAPAAGKLEENLTPVRLDPADPKSQASRREILQSGERLTELSAESPDSRGGSTDGEQLRQHDPRPRGFVVTSPAREAGATLRAELDAPLEPVGQTAAAEPSPARHARANPGVELATILVGADSGDVNWTPPTSGRSAAHSPSPIAPPVGGVEGSLRVPWLGSHEAATTVESMPGVDRLADALGASGGNRSWRVALRLDPPELGQVLVQARWSEGKLTLRVQTEDESVRQMVDARMSELRDALSRRGIRLDAADVQLGTSHDRGPTYRETDGGRSDGRPGHSHDSPGGQASHRQAEGESGRSPSRHPQPTAESTWSAGRAAIEPDIAGDRTHTAMDLLA